MLDIQVISVDTEFIDDRAVKSSVDVVEGARLVQRCPRILARAEHSPELIRERSAVRGAIDVVRLCCTSERQQNLLVTGLSAGI